MKTLIEIYVDDNSRNSKLSHKIADHALEMFGEYIMDILVIPDCESECEDRRKEHD